jgi:hypothetical protein
MRPSEISAPGVEQVLESVEVKKESVLRLPAKNMRARDLGLGSEGDLGVANSL